MTEISETEIAYQVLSQSKVALYFRDLIVKVLEKKGAKAHSVSHAMAEVHTQINMDSRFIHLGKGMWGLAEWLPQRGLKLAEESAAEISETSLRREKLLEEIQQEYTAVSGYMEEQE